MSGQIDLPGKPGGLPLKTIERLFELLLAFYGNKFVIMWQSVSADAMKETWARGLAGTTNQELGEALEKSKRECIDWPPTLPQFIAFCRPKLDYEASFNEAAQKWGTGVEMSKPAIYWAAVQIGNEIKASQYRYLQSRWKAALDYAIKHKSSLQEPSRQQAQIEDGGREFVQMPRETAELLANFGQKIAGKCV